jgi:hypothetical protein
MTTRLGPALRMTEKQGGEYEPPPRRRRPAPRAKKATGEESVEATVHQIDDLA